MDDSVVYRIDKNDTSCESQEEDYDPYLKRDPKPTITNFQALSLLIQGFLGTGIIPAVFVYKEGWLTGTVYTILIGILCSYCLHTLIRSRYQLCKFLKVPHLTYGQSMERAMETGPPSLRIFGRISHYAVDTCIAFCQLALCCIYSSTALGFVPAVSKVFLSEWSNVDMSTSTLFFISLIPLVLALFLGNLKVVANVCIFGAVILFSALAFFYWYALEDFSSFGDFKITAPDVANLPSFLGPMVLSLQAITVVSCIEVNLKSPRKFRQFWGILNFGMLIMVVAQCSIGILGYLKFGNGGNILTFTIYYNADQRFRVCIFLYAVALYVSYGLQGYILVDFLWKKTKRSRKTKICLRILLFILSFVFMVVKSTELSFIADYIVKIILIITVPVLGIIFPVILEICVKWPHDFRRAKCFLCLNILLLILGMVIVLVPLTKL